MTGVALALTSFGVAFGDQLILGDVSLELPATGMTVLVGPAGGGKSTLLRTLAGLNDCHPSLATWGRVTLDGAPMMGGTSDERTVPCRPALVMQHARFFLDSVRENLVSALPNRAELAPLDQTRIVTSRLEASGLGELTQRLGCDAVDLPLGLQRRLAIVRALMTEPRVLFADEPTAGLEDREAAEVIAMLRVQALVRAVLFVTHNQRFALAAGGTTLLLAGGRIQDRAPTAQFFSDPGSDLSRHFLRTGGCVPATPAHPPQQVPEISGGPAGAETARGARKLVCGPRGFFWILPGRLGGMPRPGIINELDSDLEGLARLEVSVLVMLEEHKSVDAAALAPYGIRAVHFPVVDMGVPAVDAAMDLCRRITTWIDAGEVVAIHCRAGLGRTGTLLACQLIYLGDTARGALDAVRAINPHCVQSVAQVDFLRSFDAALRDVSPPQGRAG